jgi:glycosyltransferase involved in cell wall biosynthesis
MKVSVIVPCFNQASYLDQALQSVLEQSYQDWECIIVNDGSTDTTQERSELWTEKDKRFSYYSKPNGGLPSARNYGIARATGVYMLPLDADDYLSPHYVAECVNALKQQGVKLVYGQVERFGEQTGIWHLKPYTYTDLMVSNMIPCCAMYRKTTWEQVGGYDETLVYGLEDWEFWVHVLNANDTVLQLKDIRFYYRIRNNSMINAMSKAQEMEIKRYVFNKHGSKYFEPFTNLSEENKILKRNLSSLVFIFRRIIKLLFRL